jgi:hypothetical protein
VVLGGLGWSRRYAVPGICDDLPDLHIICSILHIIARKIMCNYVQRCYARNFAPLTVILIGETSADIG